MSSSGMDGKQDDNGIGMPLVYPREIWGAVPPKGRAPMKHPIQKVVFHYYTPGTTSCHDFDSCCAALKELQSFHMHTVGMLDIAFNFLVGGDDIVYEGRGWQHEPDLMLKYPQFNGKRLDIAFIGDYRKRALTRALFQRAMDIINFGVKFKLIKHDYDLVDSDPRSQGEEVNGPGNSFNPRHMIQCMS